MMPGGSPVAWPYVKPIFQAICAKVEDGSPCCEWVGENGAGHFVKMVHNGIEYGDMQLICEAYQLMRDYLRMSDGEMHQAFAAWNDTELDSYLIEITRDILAYKDGGMSEEDARAMIVSGFADNVSKELPVEYAVEMNNLIRLEMKGSIG